MPPPIAPARALDRVKIEANDDWEGSEYRYCNEFLFKADAPFDEEECLQFLASMGDCELLVGAYPDFKVHVHSDRPNLVLEHMLQLGAQISEVFIHNMDMEAPSAPPRWPTSSRRRPSRSASWRWRRVRARPRFSSRWASTWWSRAGRP